MTQNEIQELKEASEKLAKERKDLITKSIQEEVRKMKGVCDDGKFIL